MARPPATLPSRPRLPFLREKICREGAPRWQRPPPSSAESRSTTAPPLHALCIAQQGMGGCHATVPQLPRKPHPASQAGCQAGCQACAAPGTACGAGARTPAAPAAPPGWPGTQNPPAAPTWLQQAGGEGEGAARAAACMSGAGARHPGPHSRASLSPRCPPSCLPASLPPAGLPPASLPALPAVHVPADRREATW